MGTGFVACRDGELLSRAFTIEPGAYDRERNQQADTVADAVEPFLLTKPLSDPWGGTTLLAGRHPVQGRVRNGSAMAPVASPAGRRGPGLQGAQEKPEFLLVFLGRQAQGREHLALDLGVVDADAAAAHLGAVQDQIISFGPCLARISFEQRDVFVERCRKGVMNGNMAKPAVRITPASAEPLHTKPSPGRLARLSRTASNPPRKTTAGAAIIHG